MSDESTLLVISGMNIPPYSARGLTQTLTPIDQATQLTRSINGVSMDLAETQFRKYTSTISCADQSSPAVEGIWPGDMVTVDCIVELSRINSSSDSDGDLLRTAVEGSIRHEGDFLFYRPRLQMRVVRHNISFDEYGAIVTWSLELEEI